MREEFIARTRNRNGRKYGFVRFKRVGNVKRLERQVHINIPRHVNIPKHKRVRMLRGESNANVKYRSGVTLDKPCNGGKHQGNLRCNGTTPTKANDNLVCESDGVRQ